MKSLSQEKVWTYSESHPIGAWHKCQVRKEQGTLVKNYIDLAIKVAAIQFHNPNFVLFFRGQSTDHRLNESLQRNSMIRPSIFRRDEGYGAPHWNSIIQGRYDALKYAESRLTNVWASVSEGSRQLIRSSVIRWAILQHYEVCDTPLLDVTTSLRVAASFASLKDQAKEAYIMVLAAPQTTGAVSACAYHEMQVLRLSGLCPPTAVRPHLQEGYLLGEYPELRTFDEKMNLELHESDFGHRLIAKFRFNPETFWDDGDFPKFSKRALSLEEDPDDPLAIELGKIRNEIKNTYQNQSSARSSNTGNAQEITDAPTS